MPDTSDILKDPTKVLDMALHTSDARLGLVEFGRIHRHMLAGGPPPAQWRGEGTAVGEACGALCDAAAFASSMMRKDLHDHFRKAERAVVTGEG